MVILHNYHFEAYYGIPLIPYPPEITFIQYCCNSILCMHVKERRYFF